jgi:hypothetical protein
MYRESFLYTARRSALTLISASLQEFLPPLSLRQSR